MGLFDKILKGVSEKAPDLKLDELAKNISGVAETLKNEAEKFADDRKDEIGQVIPGKKEGAAGPNAAWAAQASAAASAPAAGPSGVSWGDVMPDEPNQYNYGGTPIEYFEDIFRTEFPGYELAEEAGLSGPERQWIIRFRQGGADKLVVELLSAKCEAAAIREKCRKQGVPYLRYYTDYEGWWNTRSYVINRTRAALG